MTKKNDGQAGTPDDIDKDFFGESDEPTYDEEPIDGLQPGVNPDAEAMAVTLKRATHAGGDCVEVYAHGEAYPEDGLQRTQQTVLLARVTEREQHHVPAGVCVISSSLLITKV